MTPNELLQVAEILELRRKKSSLKKWIFRASIVMFLFFFFCFYVGYKAMNP